MFDEPVVSGVKGTRVMLIRMYNPTARGRLLLSRLRGRRA